MKKFTFVLIFLLLNIFFANALSLEKQILGTWNYNIASLIPPESVKENNTQVLITFMNGENGKPKNGWIQFKMTVKLDNFSGLPQKYYTYNKKATLEFEHTKHVNFKWQIKNNQLIGSVVSIENFYNDFRFKPNINVSEDYFDEISKFYTQLSKPSSEERKEMELMINSPVRFDQNGNLILFYDNSTLVKDYGEAPFKKEFTNKRYATIQYKDANNVENPYIYSYTENGYVYNPDETAFLYLYIWDENGNIVNNTDRLSETYYCMADNEGVWSNMTKIKIGCPLSLEAKCFEAENEQQKRIIIESSDSELIADRYKKLGDNHYRITVGDKVEFKVINSGVDITNQVQLKTTTGFNVPKICSFKVPGTYKIYAKVGEQSTNYATIEVMDILYFDINPDSIIQGYGATFTAYTYDKSKQQKLYPQGITIRNQNGKVVQNGNGFSRLASVGTHQFFAATDKVCSAIKNVNVVASELTLSTDRYFSKKLNRYLMNNNGNVKFKVIQNGQDITSKINVNIFDQNNKEVSKTKFLGEPGIYKFIATDGFSYSNMVVVEVRNRLFLFTKDITDKDLKDKNFAHVKLEVLQDKQDVTNSCEFFHRNSTMDWHDIGHGVSSTTISGEGWHYFKAKRDNFYESNISIIRVKDKRIERASSDVTLFVDKDTITLGESVNFLTIPEDAKVYEDDKKLDKVHTPQTTGLHIFHARKEKSFSEPISVYVKEKEDNDKKKKAPQSEVQVPNIPTFELTVNKTSISLGNTVIFKVLYNGIDCTSKATIRYESSDKEVGSVYSPKSVGKHTFKASMFGMTSNTVTVNVTRNPWVGTYQVTTPQKIVYDNISAPRIIEEPDTFEISIEYNDGYHVYGLSKEKPHHSIVAIKVGNSHLSLIGSHLTKKTYNSETDTTEIETTHQPSWVFIMHDLDTDSLTAGNSLKYYTNPAFATPYIFSMDKNGNVSCLQTSMILSETNKQFISIDIFNVNKANNTISHINQTRPVKYRAGNIMNIKKISSEVKRFTKEDSEYNDKAIPNITNQNVDEYLILEQ